MKRVIKRIFLGIAILFVSILLLFTVWDNYRISVVSQDVGINQLPRELEGFTILQISDLHEREFGENQKRILKKINAIDYDVIVITGDVLKQPDSTNYDSLYTLLEGIEDKENILYVQGNADPANYEITDTLKKSPFVEGLEARGVRLLESFDSVTVADEPIYFVNLEMAIIKNPEQIGQISGTVKPFHAGDLLYQSYQSKLWKEMIKKGILDTDNPLIALNHYPVPDLRFDYIEKDPNTSMPDFDLMIAGHYHGGQIRIPLVGALFIPDSWYEPNSFLPPQDRVKGLWEYNGIKQYVSAGLGSSEAIPYLKFRLFNTPEINVITLKREH